MRLAGLLALLLLGAPDPGTFTPDRPTDALDQPTGHRVIDRLEPGKPYRVLKTGGPDHRWCKLDTPRGPGWALCGGEAGSAVSSHHDAPHRSPSGTCLDRCNARPLFPEMPGLTTADREVL